MPLEKIIKFCSKTAMALPSGRAKAPQILFWPKYPVGPFINMSPQNSCGSNLVTKIQRKFQMFKPRQGGLSSVVWTIKVAFSHNSLDPGHHSVPSKRLFNSEMSRISSETRN